MSGVSWIGARYLARTQDAEKSDHKNRRASGEAECWTSFSSW